MVFLLPKKMTPKPAGIISMVLMATTKLSAAISMTLFMATRSIMKNGMATAVIMVLAVARTKFMAWEEMILLKAVERMILSMAMV